MTETQMLLGSLSNDLFRVATLTQRGSKTAAKRFLLEAKKWSVALENKNVSKYILRLAEDVSRSETGNISLESAEKYLMYGVLLQNYVVHKF